ncbi:MAG: HlyD family efflux transporter periplasmic adaptor subunit, partial [Balneolaceae bacterium]
TSRLTLLQRRRSLEEAGIAILNNRALIKDYEGNIEELAVEEKQQEAQLLAGAEESLKVLRSQFLAWKQTYVLESPFDGTVAFFDHLADSRFVQAGEQLMTVIPDRPGIYGLVHIPVSGSGRVKTGQSMNISLENYPVEEVGRVRGIVEHISPLPRENSYSIRVRLPDGLRTSYGQTLEFRQQMQGTADIITEDLRLIERFFYQFRSLMDQAG